jgi:hypothetical protein
MLGLAQWRVAVYLADHYAARDSPHQSSSASSRNPWLSITLPFCVIGT